MRKTVDQLCSSHPKLDTGLKVLNIGFGLGIVRESRFRSSCPRLTFVKIDTMFQSLSKPPSLHVIVEAHPDVLGHMEEKGWHEKAGAKILRGTWQDVLSSNEFLELGKFDVVYTDTFAEQYGGELSVLGRGVIPDIFAELHRFFKRLPDLLDGPDARFSFFNGLGATSTSESFSLRDFRLVLTRSVKMRFFTTSTLVCPIVICLKLGPKSNGMMSRLDFQWTTQKVMNDGEGHESTSLCPHTTCQSPSLRKSNELCHSQFDFAVQLICGTQIQISGR